MIEKISGYFNDDGTEFNPNLKPAPALCATCRKNDNPAYETACNLTRHDQEEDIFICFAYESLRGSEENQAILKEMEQYLHRKYGRSE